MKIQNLLFLSILPFALCEKVYLDDYCRVQLGNQYFNLAKLQKPGQDYRLSYETQNGRRDLYFNFCQSPQHVCRDSIRDYGHMTRPDDTCVHFTGDNQKNLFKDLLRTTFVDYINQDDKREGLSVIYENKAQMCENESPYSLRINLYCDQTYDEPQYKIDDKTAIRDSCTFQVNMKTKYGCGGSAFGLMWEFIDIYYIYFGIYILAAGLFYVLYSIEYYKICSVIAAIETLLFMTFWIIFQFFIKQDYSYILFGWIAVPVAIIIGGTLGYYASIYQQKLSDFIIGSMSGFIFIQLLLSLLTQIFPNFYINSYIYYAIVVTCYISTGLLSLNDKFRAKSLILSTCLSGAYQICAVLFSNHLIAIQAKNWQYALYFTTVILISMISFFFQYRYYISKEEVIIGGGDSRNKNNDNENLLRSRQKNYWASAPQQKDQKERQRLLV
eukprot:403363602